MTRWLTPRLKFLSSPLLTLTVPSSWWKLNRNPRLESFEFLLLLHTLVLTDHISALHKSGGRMGGSSVPVVEIILYYYYIDILLRVDFQILSSTPAFVTWFFSIFTLFKHCQAYLKIFTEKKIKKFYLDDYQHIASYLVVYLVDKSTEVIYWEKINHERVFWLKTFTVQIFRIKTPLTKL